MKWIISILIVIILGLGGAAYWKYVNTDSINVLDHCPKDTWMVIQTSNMDSLIKAMSDSSSIYSAVPALTQLISGIEDIQSDAELEGKQSTLFISSSTTGIDYTLVAQKIGNAKELWIRQFINSDQLQLYSTFEQIEVMDAEERNKIQNELESNNSSFKLSLKPGKFIDFFGMDLSRIQHDILRAEFAGTEWISPEIDNEGTFFVSALSKIDNIDAERQNASDLIRFLPQETNSALLLGTLNYSIALVECDYDQTSSKEEKTFVVIGNVDSSLVSKLINQQNQKVFKVDGNEFQLPWTNGMKLRSISDAIVIGANNRMVERFINDFKSFNRIDEAASFKALNHQFSDASFTLYIRNLSKSIGEDLDTKNNNMVNGLLIQTGSEIAKSKFYSLSATHHQVFEDKLKEVWSVWLDTDVEAGPWAFENHYTGEKELIVQDKLKQLYLINADGKVLWKKQLDELVIGEVSLLDAFASGKNQMLFTTSKRLHLVDRNGNDVDGFPIRLSEGTMTAPTAVRYSKGSDLRILVSDGKILKNYNADGKAVKGWKTPEVGELKTPIEYWKFGNKDYLIGIVESGDIIILDRAGKKRQGNIATQASHQDVYFDKGKSLNNSSIVFCDSAGNLINVSFAKKQSAQQIMPVDKTLSFLFNSNSSAPYVAASDKQLISFDQDFNVSVDFLFPNTLSENLSWVWKEKGWVAASTPGAGQVYIIDLAEGPLNKMPIEGDEHCIAIDLDKNGVRELVSHRHHGELVAYNVQY